MKLIIALGNPGTKYQNTRHNVGFMALDFIFKNWLAKQNFSLWKESKKFQAELSEGTINSEKIILAKPQTFMNDSGLSVQTLSSYYKLSPSDLIVVHDDLDIEFGKYKIQTDRSSAGHNGVKSIIEHLGTQNFTRIRIGIGRADKEKQGEIIKFVLNKFNLLERLKLKEVEKNILEELKNII
jgi:PTH1 family peptidyl-tRNA hydrolase